MVRVLAQSARDPGFESPLGHVLFPPETFNDSVWVRALTGSSKGTVSLISGMVLSRLQDKSI